MPDSNAMELFLIWDGFLTPCMLNLEVNCKRSKKAEIIVETGVGWYSEPGGSKCHCTHDFLNVHVSSGTHQETVSTLYLAQLSCSLW